ncbi:efflux RND transporter periplasmic adaptor subunit [Halalkalibacter urbisdiaboli]|uniref:efflux RND transporter periplasmic adaptor subunit n=1 Tax=Halalkalibacter urbisdiaboli TaxID=1960589 RepID=UPI000B437DBB|nr:HlyD family efflux transporter periplasmic adaptor subunit [Halalkalibacter urbisdiaboli]
MQKKTILAYFMAGALSTLIGCTESEEVAHYSGIIEGKKTLIQTEISGLVHDIHIEDGAEIKENDLLLSLDTRKLDLEIDNAKAAIDIAKAKKVDAEDTDQDTLIAQANGAVEQAEIQLKIVELQKEKLSIESPLEGVVQDVHITVGELANPGETLITIIDDSVKELVVFIAEQDLSLAEKGKEVTIQSIAYEDKTFKGTIKTIATEAEFTPKNIQTKEERAKRVFAVTIDVSDATELKPGMTVDVNF